ncbi:hypothetical protein [Onishia taeanensis]|uniref:hypothetical protein n=1 Tax=Onishia taeanensis TaxID=284577 RepID=UPI000B823FCE|nr:hypothetical protein [Halomonas taeanensis]
MVSTIRWVPGWVWLLLAGLAAAVTGWLHLETVTAEREAALADLRAARIENTALVATLEWRRQQAERKDAALAERTRALEAANDETATARAALTRLERDDAETADWSSTAVPEAVIAWVKKNIGSTAASSASQ